MSLRAVVHSNPNILGGTPVFVGTEVPLRNFIKFLETSCSIDQFLEDYPSVSRQQVVAVLEELLASATRPRAERPRVD